MVLSAYVVQKEWGNNDTVLIYNTFSEHTQEIRIY